VRGFPLEADFSLEAREIAEETKRGEFVVGPNEGVATADLQTQLKSKTELAIGFLRCLTNVEIFGV